MQYIIKDLLLSALYICGSDIKGITTGLIDLFRK
jgi:hypothetical protein